MLSDRPYMRDDYQRERTSLLTWLLSAIAAGFVLQIVLGSPWFGGGQSFNDLFALTIPALHAGRIWTLFTHSFLHSTHFLFHIIGNVLALFFLGRELLPMLGGRRFLGLYAMAIVL